MKKLKGFIITVLVLAVIAGGLAGYGYHRYVNDEGFKEEINLKIADYYYSYGDYENAIEWYRKTSFDDYNRLYREYYEILWAKGRYFKAIEIYDRIDNVLSLENAELIERFSDKEILERLKNALTDPEEEDNGEKVSIVIIDNDNWQDYFEIESRVVLDGNAYQMDTNAVIPAFKSGITVFDVKLKQEYRSRIRQGSYFSYYDLRYRYDAISRGLTDKKGSYILKKVTRTTTSYQGKGAGIDKITNQWLIKYRISIDEDGIMLEIQKPVPCDTGKKGVEAVVYGGNFSLDSFNGMLILKEE
mgnify:CR=1 FL=1